MDDKKVKLARQFGVELSEDTLEKLETLANDTNTDFKTILGNASKEQDALSEEELVNELERRFRVASSSSAEEFRGIILGYETSGDIYARKKQDRREIYENDPQKAQNMGVTDSDGVPLWIDSDNGATAEPGEPIPETYIITVFGIGEKASEEGDVRFFQMRQFTEDESEIEDIEMKLPVNETVKFMANDNSDRPDTPDEEFNLNFSSMTMDSMKKVEIDMPEKKVLYENCLEHRLEDMSDLRKKLKTSSLESGNIILIDGYVSDISQSSNGGKRIVVAQSGARDSVSLLLPDYMDPDFGELSDIMVIGNAWKPSGDGDEPTDLLLNTYDVAVKENVGPDSLRGLGDGDEDDSDSEDSSSEEEEGSSPDAEEKFGIGDSEDEEETEEQSEETQEEDSSEEGLEDAEEDEGGDLFS